MNNRPASSRLARAKFALPSLVTLLSIACGFTSIIVTVDNTAADAANAAASAADFRLAAALLVLAGLFDALDGFVARVTGTSSAFGVQLDSIADVVNFGCAPAILLYCYGFLHLPEHDALLLRIGAGASFFFAACGALRLARFNVQVGHADPRYFVGMPITAGAACVASAVVGWPEPAHTAGDAWRVVALLIGTGSLMVSTLRFPSTKQSLPRGGMAMAALAAAAVSLGWLAAVLGLRFFAAAFALYVTAALTLNVLWRAGWRGIEPPERH